MGMTPVMREKQDIFRALNPAVINLTKLLLPLVPVTSTLYFVISITHSRNYCKLHDSGQTSSLSKKQM